MAHPDDFRCRFCHEHILHYTALGIRSPCEHVCKGKPPLTPADGAAAAFGLMGMAEAIRQRERAPRCSFCGGAPPSGYKLGDDGRCKDEGNCIMRHQAGRDRRVDSGGSDG